MPETGFEAWSFETTTRSFERNAKEYGIDLWIGTPNEDTDVDPLDMIFIHRNEFSNWFGDNNKDINYSCWIKFKTGTTEQAKAIFDSIEVRKI